MTNPNRHIGTDPNAELVERMLVLHPYIGREEIERRIAEVQSLEPMSKDTARELIDRMVKLDPARARAMVDILIAAPPAMNHEEAFLKSQLAKLDAQRGRMLLAAAVPSGDVPSLLMTETEAMMADAKHEAAIAARDGALARARLDEYDRATPPAFVDFAELGLEPGGWRDLTNAATATGTGQPEVTIETVRDAVKEAARVSGLRSYGAPMLAPMPVKWETVPDARERHDHIHMSVDYGAVGHRAHMPPMIFGRERCVPPVMFRDAVEGSARLGVMDTPPHLTPRGCALFHLHNGRAPLSCAVCGALIARGRHVSVTQVVPGSLTPSGTVYALALCGSLYCVARADRGDIEPRTWWARQHRWIGVTPVWA